MAKFSLMLLLAITAPVFAADPVQKRALLVGVSKYPELAERFQLEGPANDVELMATTLVERLGFPADSVDVFSETRGTAKAEKLPTKAHIAAAFKKLADQSGKGDFVFILMGGHGTQQPEDARALEPEPDGLDEVFLPRDVGKWDDKVGVVANGITDNELGAWIGAILREGAFVWCVFDACHSGTMTRSNDVERDRKVEPEKGLGIPAARIKEAEAKAAARNGEKPRGDAPAPGLLHADTLGEVVAIYAAQPTECTPERPLPMGGKNAKVHGILTYTICQALTQAQLNGSDLTYRELAKKIHAQYAAWGRYGPTPMIEGKDMDRVIGSNQIADPSRSTITLRKTADGYRVSVGQLAGLTPDSVLEVRSPAGEKDKLLGYVKLTDVNTSDADAVICEYEKVPKAATLPDGARCKIAYVDYGDSRIAVAVATHSNGESPSPLPVERVTAIRSRLQAAITPTSRFRMVPPAEASWALVALPDGRVSLTLAEGVPDAKKGGPVPPVYGPVPMDDKFAEWLDVNLGKISRHESLRRLAGESTAEAQRGAAPDTPLVKLEVFLAKNKTDKQGTPLSAKDDLFAVHDRDPVLLKLTNIGRVSCDVTLLYLDRDHAIEGIYPPAGRDNRLTVGGSDTVRVNINGKTFGREHLLLVAVKADGLNQDFLSLTQPGPEKLKSVPSRGGGDTFKELLLNRAYGEGKTRGVSVQENRTGTLRLVNFEVIPDPRSK